jgi:hypothetical protein
MVYTGTQTHVIIREIGHTLVARITKYNTTTTYNILRTVTCTSPPDFRLEKEIGKTGWWVGIASRAR